MRKVVRIACLMALGGGLAIGCGDDPAPGNTNIGAGDGDGDSSGDGDGDTSGDGDGDIGDGDGDGDGDTTGDGDGDTTGDGDGDATGEDCVFDDDTCLSGAGVADVCVEDLEGTLGTCAKTGLTGTCTYEEGGEDVVLSYYDIDGDPWENSGDTAEEDCEFYEGTYSAK